jgi:putative SOS response-associated peptidase YedK
LKYRAITILTTGASEPVADLHNRMPVILEPENFNLWLDPQEQKIEHLRISFPICREVIAGVR